MRPPSEETIALAPAAGAGVGKILAGELLGSEWFVPAMVNAVRNGLHATRSFWTKEGMHTEADSKTQLQAFALVMAHMEGEPIKRIIHQHLGAGKAIDPADALRESPELAAAVARELEKANWRKGGGERAKARAAQRAEAIEVAPPPGAAGSF